MLKFSSTFLLMNYLIEGCSSYILWKYSIEETSIAVGSKVAANTVGLLCWREHVVYVEASSSVVTYRKSDMCHRTQGALPCTYAE